MEGCVEPQHSRNQLHQNRLRVLGDQAVVLFEFVFKFRSDLEASAFGDEELGSATS